MSADADETRTSVDARGIARLEIDRPHRMNALDGAANVAITEAMSRWSTRDDIHAVVIDGVGGSFSTGADVGDLFTGGSGDGGGLDPSQARGVISAGSDLARAIRSVGVPVIASVDGPAAGIGASMAFAADLVYATVRSYFLMAFVNIGLMPDGGASMSVATSIGRVRANELTLLGEKLPAAGAYDAGLINKVVTDRAALDETVEAVVEKLSATSPRALRLTKAALSAHTMGGFEAALERELAGQTELLQSPEFQKSVAAFMAR